ncbi:class II peroxidase [Didymella exigua CBS 183.55]|uniref:Peroxidase n=1 Tax=Didymella exigua CBS 183.55 TaxID=1150837 RepID=A0A6A5RN55_9PLEO|nr:class II peroxidase [Didymella exigua CBS 183.55]KAF1929079.1 class II peroxidase [Didymella exigua CBS 183.55]
MFHKLILALPLLSLTFLALASPLEERQSIPGLIDNLLTGILSGVSQLIKNVLAGTTSGIDNAKSNKPPLCSSMIDSCCAWYDVSAELTKLFLQADGGCNDNARAAVRFGFHDAGAWDKTSPNGGADGSLLMNFGEIDRPENNGLQSIRGVLQGVQQKYRVGYADLVQYAHNHATVTCPKGPRIRTFVGRKDATKAAPTGLLPDVRDSADNLIALFERKGFSAHDLAALVGAHATAKQRFVDVSQAGKPLDTTPTVWDVEFYNDTLNQPTMPNDKIFVLPSDKVLSVHPKVNGEWKQFVGNQQHWNEDYSKAYIRMSLTGVTNLKDLRDCTKTLPASRPNFVAPKLRV